MSIAGKMMPGVICLLVLSLMAFAHVSCARSAGGQRVGNSDYPLSVSNEAGSEKSLADIETEIREYAAPSEVDGDLVGILKQALWGELEVIENDREHFAAQSNDGRIVADLTFHPASNSITWSYENQGDYDMNGEVGVPDITPIARHYLALTNDGVGDDALETWIDGDGNGEVGVSDIVPIALHYLNNVSHYRVLSSQTPDGQFQEIATFSADNHSGRRPIVFQAALPEGEHNYIRIQPVDAKGFECESSNTVETGLQYEWITEEVVSGEGIDIYIKLALRNSSEPSIAYLSRPPYSLENYQLKYASRINEQWTSESTGASTYSFDDLDLCIDSLGNPHIVYGDITNLTSIYITNSGDQWHTSSFYKEDVYSSDPEIETDINDRPCIAFVGQEGASWPYKYYLYYAVLDGEEWTCENIGDSGSWLSMDLDSSGNPHISYSRVVDCYETLSYLFLNDTGWHVEDLAVNPPWALGKHTSNVVGGWTISFIRAYSYTDVHIAADLYYDDGDIYHETMLFSWDGVNWKEQSFGNDEIYPPLLEMDAFGNLHILYKTSHLDNRIKYAAYDGSDWQSWDIGQSNWLGISNYSLALDEDGIAHICYSNGEADTSPYDAIQYVTMTRME